MASKWKNIGLALRLAPDSLNTLSIKEDVTDCLREVLTQWLKKTYNVKRFGEPSWKLLVKAVSDQAGGNDRALAQRIAQKHQGIYDSTVYVMDGIYNNYTSFFPQCHWTRFERRKLCSCVYASIGVVVGM